MDWTKYFMFDTMITPWLIRVLYFLAQIVVIIVSFAGAIGGNDLFGMGNGIIFAIFFLLIASLIVRLIFELIMVQFKISENTSQLKDILNEKQDHSPIYVEASGKAVFCGQCGEKQVESTESDVCVKCGNEL